MERIKQSHLEGLVKRINEATGSPLTPYSRVSGKTEPRALNYHLDYAYGGVCLVRMCKKGSGISSVSEGGFGTKRELFTWMRAFLAGFEVATK